MSFYEVVVSNIGTVYSGENGFTALSTYQEYLAKARQESGRASEECLTMVENGEIVKEDAYFAVGWQAQIHIARNGYAPLWYVSDLPGHHGTTKIKSGPETKSDWGWTDNKEKAIRLTPYWQMRFKAFAKRDAKRNWGLMPIGAGE